MRKLMQPLLDTILGWTVSKKLTVFIIGTIITFIKGDITDNWLILAGIYLSIQGFMDGFSKYLKSKKDKILDEINNIDIDFSEEEEDLTIIK